MLDLIHPCNSQAIKSQQHQKANYDVNTKATKLRAGDLVSLGTQFQGGKDGCQEQ